MTRRDTTWSGPSPGPGGASQPARPSRLVLVGVGGYGAVHATRIAGRQRDGTVQLVAAVDPVRTTPPPVIAGTPLFASLPEALAAAGPVDVVVVAAPIGEHARLAELAMGAGADVLLEKPPVAALTDFHRLLEVERATGRVVQVGFQSLGSPAPALLGEDAYGLGTILTVTATGAWSRTVGYWDRSSWAGRRSLHGQPVIDGVVTNPLAHATATALAVAGCRTVADVAEVETDLYRANAIDSDDTSVVRIRTATGMTVTCAFTLCAAAQEPPLVQVTGSRGRASLSYTEDRLELDLGGAIQTVSLPRADLLENLLAFRQDGAPLLVPLASTGAFMRVLDAVSSAGEPVRIDPRSIAWSGEGEDRRAVVADVEHWVRRAAESQQTFAELAVPWAHRGRDRVTARGVLDGAEVLASRDGAGTIPTSTPRPYLHPVRTLGGVVVSATHPADHDWHTGVGMAVPDVDGTNFWGGGTYCPGRGYQLLDDHGAVTGGPVRHEPGGFHQQLDWVGRDGRRDLTEQRRVHWARLTQGRWQLSFGSSLTAERQVTLQSPGSKGRAGGGYGGFFWRLPACEDVDVFTATGRGEEAVHGTVAPWLAWSAEFAAGPGISGPATILVRSIDVTRHADPWFVRVQSYPGLGSALAWARPVVLAPGQTLERRFEVLVADGRLDREAAAAAAAELSG